MAIHPDYTLSSYQFSLPEPLIAQAPAAKRGESRLLVLDKQSGNTTLACFSDIISFLPPGCLLVANNSRVIPARVFGNRPSGGRVEFLLLTPPPLLDTRQENNWNSAAAEGLLRSSKKAAKGETICFSPHFKLVVEERGEFGRCQVRLFWQGDILSLLASLGSLPLPPYIKREDLAKAAHNPAPPSNWGTDATRYQTVYANKNKAGSVAAPTAGLHFTPELCAALQNSGRDWAELTLYVGYGTFSPVRCEDIREHTMHSEYVELPAHTAQAVRKAKAEGRPVVAIGTTSVRVLEGVANLQPSKTLPETGHVGPVSLFLYPGKPFHVVDAMVTNFHLPGSSLLMLVSAFAGREQVLRAYNQAIAEQFRFFSYGDAMLIR